MLLWLSDLLKWELEVKADSAITCLMVEYQGGLSTSEKSVKFLLVRLLEMKGSEVLQCMWINVLVSGVWRVLFISMGIMSLHLHIHYTQ